MAAKKPGQQVRGSTTGKPVMVILDALGQRWALRILWELRDGRLTFRDLQSRCGEVSPTIVNRRLKELRELQIVDHQTGGYGYTSDGAELASLLHKLNKWSDDWARHFEPGFEPGEGT